MRCAHECRWFPADDYKARCGGEDAAVSNSPAHVTPFKLANQGVDTRALQHYLRHKNIQHTVRYTELSPDRFRDFWRD
jgi:site-specific recombinase XerD